jgi:hypothetical protein
MNQYQFSWAVFVAVLCPLFLRQPVDPLWMTAAQIALCLGMVALANKQAA